MVILDYKGPLTSIRPTEIAKQFKSVMMLYLPEENKWPQATFSPKTPVKIKVNQLLNSAVFERCQYGLSDYQKQLEGITIKVSRSLNTGMASAIIQAIIQRPAAIPTHDATATKFRLCM